MKKEHEEFFDHRWLMKPWGENSILFTAEFAALDGGLTPEQAKIAIESYFEKDKDRWWFDDQEGWSHDNMTAALCLSNKFGFDYHKKLYPNNYHSYFHPRDAAFYFWLAYPILGLPFLWITSVCMIWGALFTTYKNIDGDLWIATDGDLLAFLKTRTCNMPLTQFIVDAIMKKKWGGYEKFFSIYFRDENHPNRELSKGL